MWLFIQNISIFLHNAGFSTSNLTIFASLIFATVIAFLFFVKYLGTFFLVSLERHFQNGHFELWLSLVKKLHFPIIIFNGFYYACLVLPFPATIHNSLTHFYLFISVIFFIDVLTTFIINFIKAYLKTKNVSAQATKTAINFVSVVSTIVLWILAILIFLQLSPVDTQALLGGLGVASIIVAFSFQSILKDIFAFFSIYIDKSFSVGDYVIFDKYEGAIREIRLRTTKIQGIKGNTIIVSNYQLTNGIIENFNDLKKRRVALEFKIDNRVSAHKLSKVIEELETVFLKPELKRLEFIVVNFDKITDLGLLIRVVYRFPYKAGEENYLTHLAYKQQVNLHIMSVIERNHLNLIQGPVIEKTAP